MASDIRKKVSQQYDFRPYPDKPIEEPLPQDAELLFWNSLATIYYVTQKRVINPNGKLILDAGCGTGWKSLGLAAANPGARVVGVDISPKSVDLARQRLQYHGFTEAEFHVLAIEDLPNLGLQFDYINCDEVLFFLPEPVAGLRGMKSVLKESGIIRANLHSAFQREALYRAQAAFKLLGLMEDNPEDLEIGIALEIMENFRDDVDVKVRTWQQAVGAADDLKKSFIARDFLLQGDKGYKIPEMFAMLQSADLEFLGMVNWQDWLVEDLFQDGADDLAFLALTLPELSVEERLHLCELWHPVNRKLDFWCGHPGIDVGATWDDDSLGDGDRVRVYLHPLLVNDEVRLGFIESIQEQESLDLGGYLGLSLGDTLVIDAVAARCLFGLQDGPLLFSELVEIWVSLHPEMEVTEAVASLRDLLMGLESGMVVLFERL